MDTHTRVVIISILHGINSTWRYYVARLLEVGDHPQLVWFVGFVGRVPPMIRITRCGNLFPTLE